MLRHGAHAAHRPSGQVWTKRWDHDAVPRPHDDFAACRRDFASPQFRQKDFSMRKLWLVTATLLLASSSPSLAERIYPWCARMPVNGSNPECNFDTYAQCQATISGISGTCIENPIVLFQRMQGGGYAGPADMPIRQGRKSRHY
jgi:hypothetical protein